MRQRTFDAKKRPYEYGKLESDMLIKKDDEESGEKLDGRLGVAKKQRQSIYTVTDAKDKHIKLGPDSTSMGYAVFMKENLLGFDLEYKDRTEVFMNSMIVYLVQAVMIFAIWKFAAENDKFAVIPPNDLVMNISRFIASMFMHINVERDV